MLGRHEEAIQGQNHASACRMINDMHNFFIKDLRAVLRLQPTNMDAIRELAALLYPGGMDELDRLCATGRNNNSSSSSGSAHTPSSEKEQHQERLRRLGIPLPKNKPPPFRRTRADDRKLKITLTSWFGDGTNGKHRKGPANSIFDLGYGPAVQQPEPVSRHGKEKAGTMRNRKTKEMDRMRAECVNYPSWDRYAVKKV